MMIIKKIVRNNAWIQIKSYINTETTLARHHFQQRDSNPEPLSP